MMVFICSRLHHEKWQLVFFMIAQTALIDSLASVGVNDKTQAIITIVIGACYGYIPTARIIHDVVAWTRGSARHVRSQTYLYTPVKANENQRCGCWISRNVPFAWRCSSHNHLLGHSIVEIHLRNPPQP